MTSPVMFTFLDVAGKVANRGVHIALAVVDAPRQLFSLSLSICSSRAAARSNSERYGLTHVPAVSLWGGRQCLW